jgi:methylenetetrahydrofolate reductase (NADPH)
MLQALSPILPVPKQNPRTLTAAEPVSAMNEATLSTSNGPRAQSQPAISFEFFPPKSEEMEKSLWETINRLAPLTPNFVSVTYGAGGSTRERTHATITRILGETELLPAAHLTCVGAARGEIDDIVARYHETGVRHIVALRGDPPGGIGTPFSTHPDGYQTSSDLVGSIKKRFPDIEVSVSAYPEKHPESPSFDADIDGLKAKVDAGAARAITQVFFDNDLYFRYLDRVRARGIDIPIVPGIMPMHNFKQARNFVTRAGTTVPDWLAEKFDGLDDDAETRKLVAATVAAGQVQKLNKHGVDTFHFYTMNRADLVFAICHLLGIRPAGAQKAA